jgi:hypothetical protein
MALSTQDRRKVGGQIQQDRARDIGDYSDFTNRFRDYGTRAADTWRGAQDFGLGQIRGMYDELAGGGGGGGVPGYGGELDEYQNWYKNVRDLGATSADQANALRGWGTFKNFAETGGWSAPEMADFRARGAIGAPEIYGGLRDELSRGRAVQGGYGPGYGTAMSALSRDRARAMGEQQLGVETNLANSIRQGKQWGATSGSSAEQQVLENMFRGQQGAQGIAQQIADINRSAAASNASRGRQSMQDRLGLLDAYTGLARQTGGEIPYGQTELAGLGGRTGALQGYSDLYNKTQQKGPGFWDRFTQIAAAAGPTLASFVS